MIARLESIRADVMYVFCDVLRYYDEFLSIVMYCHIEYQRSTLILVDNILFVYDFQDFLRNPLT